VWLEILLNLNDETLYARIDRRKKLNLFLVLKTLGYQNDIDILSLFPTYIDVEDDYSLKQAEGVIILEKVVSKSGEVLAEKGSVLTPTLVEIFREHGIDRIKVANKYIHKTYLKLKERLKCLLKRISASLGLTWKYTKNCALARCLDTTLQNPSGIIFILILNALNLPKSVGTK